MRIFRSVFVVLLLCTQLVAQNGTWEWVKGNNFPGGSQIDSTPLGTFSPYNTPTALRQAASWTDLQGKFWLFGGDENNGTFHNELWKFDPVIEQWALMYGGDSIPNCAGVYGTQGVPSPLNHPGARATGPACWVDLQGNLWMFGGDGCDATGTYGDLNDLWKYDVITNEWTWMNGSNTVNSNGNFGTIQVPAASNEPPSRASSSAAWVDTNGDLWMFGGRLQTGSDIDAVWRYSISTNMWTWMAGSSTGAPVNYGTLGVAAPTNNPGSRMVHAHWTDQNGKFWMFGGYYSGFAAGDLWEFDPVTLEWTWMGGSNSTSSATTFTQQCVFGGYPAARGETNACWTDGCGRMWGFGGVNSFIDSYNDLWLFDPATAQFKWVTNSLALYQNGVWGTQGVPSTSNHPPGMLGSMPFYDTQGNLWMFGGYQSSAGFTYNTMWKYTPDTSCVSSSVPVVTANASSNSGCAPFNAQFSSSASPGTIYQWNFGDPSTTSDTSSAANPNYTYTNPGTYVVTFTATSTGFCSNGQAVVTFTVTVASYPVANAGTDVMTCPGNPVQLNASGGSTYSWSPSATLNNAGIANPLATPAQQTDYIVTISNGPCTDVDTVTVGLFPPAVIIISNDTTVEPGDTVQLFASGAVNYQWSPSTGLSCTNCPNPVATPTVTTDYCVTAIDSNGCSVTDCVRISAELNCGELYIPNAFSPNNDGNNDVLFVRFKNGCYTLEKFTVFDRWGTKVFETTDASTGWDGSVNGKKGNIGVYVYEADVVNNSGEHELKQGNVSLVR